MNKKIIDFSSVDLVLKNLCRYGEITNQEAENPQLSKVLHFFEKDGYLYQLVGKSWAATDQFLALLPAADITTLKRKIFFNHPQYRLYLITIAASEITRHGVEGAMVQAEEWVIDHFAAVSANINQCIDRVEANLGKPVKACSPGELIREFKKLTDEIRQDEGTDFEAWNKAFLGVSGTQEAVFQAIIARNALAAENETSSEPMQPITRGRITNLKDELAASEFRPVFCPFPDDVTIENGSFMPYDTVSPWLKRRSVFSSIPLINPADPQADYSISDLQDALGNHPVSWVLIQLGIFELVQQTGAGIGRLRLYQQGGDPKNNAAVGVELDHIPLGRVCALIPEFMAVLGFRWIAPFETDLTRELYTLMTAMIKAGIFELNEQLEFVLTETFASSLFERPRYQLMNKGVKPFREKLIRILEKRIQENE